MDPAGLELERREQAIEFGNRSPADRASAPPSASLRPTEVIDEIMRHDDGCGVGAMSMSVPSTSRNRQALSGGGSGLILVARNARCGQADATLTSHPLAETSTQSQSSTLRSRQLGAMVQCGTMLSTVAFRVDDDSRSPAPSASMRIAQIAPLMESVPPRLYGGTERIVSWLTEELVRQGHDVTLFASGDSMTASKLYRAPRRRSDCRKR